MKKLLAIVTVVVVLGVAGVAVAEHREWERRGEVRFCPCAMGPRLERGARDDGWRSEPRMDRRDGRDWDRNGPCRGPRMMEGRWGRHGGMMHRGEGWRSEGMMMRPEMGRRMEQMWKNVPDDIRAKMVDLAKLRIDMRDALTRDPVDRAKATEVHAKMATLMQDIGTWRFNQRLDRIEQRQKQMELNRTVPGGAASLVTSGDTSGSK